MVCLNLGHVVTKGVIDSSSGNNTDDSSQIEETGFDMNTVVVLAVLLCTLAAALALNSIIHYVLRRRRELLEAASATVAGLEKRTAPKIPVEVFRLGMDVPATECSICLGDFVDGEKVRVLPECNHEFHVKCVDKWLVEHKSCPNCRQLVTLTPEGDRTTSEGGRGTVNPGQHDDVVVGLIF